MKKDTAERTYIVFRISFFCLLINKITLNFFKFFSKNVLTFGERYSILCLVVKTCASGSVGGARPCQGRGRGFESRLALFYFVRRTDIFERCPSFFVLHFYLCINTPGLSHKLFQRFLHFPDHRITVHAIFFCQPNLRLYSCSILFEHTFPDCRAIGISGSILMWRQTLPPKEFDKLLCSNFRWPSSAFRQVGPRLTDNGSYSTIILKSRINIC